VKIFIACLAVLAALCLSAAEGVAWDCPRPTVFNPRSLEAPPFLYCPPGLIRIPPPLPRDRASRLRPIPVPASCGPTWVTGGCVILDGTAICW
jgi:hypothetical protein